MSADTPIDPERAPVLRREALLPSERSRGLGTIAVVCTMAGVASGLALATTLMAMQVADSMSVRQCPYHVTMSVQPIAHEHGFLGVGRLEAAGDVATVGEVKPGTPAAIAGLKRGDHVVALDGELVRSFSDLHDRVYNALPGHEAELIIERDGSRQLVHATLGAWPVVRNSY